MEDSECDAELVLHELQHGGYEPTWERVDTAAALTAALERRSWDVILCDYVMPRFSAMAALSLLRQRNCDLPTIIVSGEVGEEVAAETMRAGAHDYVSKHKLTRLVPAVERELMEAEERRARERAEEALRESEDRYRDLVENSQDLLCTHDLEGRILSMNAAPARALGYEPKEVLGRNIQNILAPEVREQFVDYLATIRRDGVAKGLMLVLTRTGERRIWEYHNTLRTDGVAAPIVRGMARDVTERVRAEAALRQAEERLRLAQQAARVTTWDWDIPRGTVTWLGILEAQPGSRPGTFSSTFEALLELVHLPDRQLVRRSMDRTVADDVDFDIEFRMLKSDGSVRWIASRGHVLRDASRKPVRMLGVGIEITERKRAEAALRDSERHFRSLIENGMDLVAILSVDGVFRYASPTHEQASGFKPEELVGKSAFDFIHPDDVAETRRRFAEGVQQGRTTGTAEYRFLQKDGSWHYIEGIARNLIDDPVVKGILVNSRDITERKRAEEATRHLNAELEQRLSECTEKLKAATKDRKALS
ncbi:MAG: PAS domain S-box protein [Candidatus Binatia bacterium]